jgi:MprA protease rhombosortase-interaction domain-containing protein
VRIGAWVLVILGALLVVVGLVGYARRHATQRLTGSDQR